MGPDPAPAPHRQGREDLFYATTPPGRLIDAMDSGQLVPGQLLDRRAADKLWPDVFMTGPASSAAPQVQLHRRLVVYTRNRGVVLLVRAGNPKGIRGIRDLMRDDVRVAISSPEREPASYESYSNTLRAQAAHSSPSSF